MAGADNAITDSASFRAYLTRMATILVSRKGNGEILRWMADKYLSSYPQGSEPRDNELPYWVKNVARGNTGE